jgi:hypothetical protein
MVDNKILDSLQEEIKLMKGELKQSLASVRDYLLNMELPSSEISNILTALSEENQTVTMKGNLEMPKGEKPPEEPEDDLSKTEESVEEEETPDTDDLLDLEEPEEEQETIADAPEDSIETEEEETTPEEEIVTPEDKLIEEPEDEITEPEEPALTEPELSADEEQPMQEEQPMPYENTSEDLNMSVPKVNMLANLINWVARANKEIGRDQIPTFLEVYGISGHLTPELKEVILRLSELAQDESDITSSTEIWSQAMLLLHGILTGGDAPLHPSIPSWNSDEKLAPEEEIIEVDKNKDKSIKLKLVLPDSDGEDREFCINLTPEADGDTNKLK